MTVEDDLVAILDGMVAAARGGVLSRLAASVSTLVAAGGDGTVVVSNPEGLFDLAAWSEAAETTVRPVMTTMIADLVDHIYDGHRQDRLPPSDLLAASLPVVDRHVEAVKRWGSSLQASVARLASQATTDRWPMATLVEKMEELRLLSVAHAAQVAADEVHAARQAASQIAAMLLDRLGRPVLKEWKTMRDDRVRDSHVEADWQRVPVDSPFEVGGHEAQYPGDPSLPIEERANCRCVIVLTTIGSTVGAAAMSPSAWAAVRLDAFRRVADENRDKGTGRFKPKNAPDTPRRHGDVGAGGPSAPPPATGAGGSHGDGPITPSELAKIQGQPGEPVQVRDGAEAVEELLKGNKVELPNKREVSVMLDRLHALAQDAKAKGEKAPSINLCQVTVKGSSLFCVKSKGIPRLQMPQLTGPPTPGSRAAALPRDKRGNVDLSAAFRDHLRSQGVQITDERVLASSLMASQNELNGVKVAGIMHAIENGTFDEAPIFVSRDSYIVDGHHRWGATVGADYEDGTDNLTMPVSRIDMGILELLTESNQFATEWGIPQAAMVVRAAAWAQRQLDAFRRVDPDHRDRGTGRFKPAAAPDTPRAPGEAPVDVEAAIRSSDVVAHPEKVDDRQLWARQDFLGPKYARINEAARIAAGDDRRLGGYKRTVHDLDEAIVEHGISFDRDITVHRGLRDADAARLASAAPGEIVVSHGFMSTSADRDVADMFAGLSTDSPGVVASITVPAGTRMLPGAWTEGELVLPRGGGYRVLSVTPGEIGAVYLPPPPRATSRRFDATTVATPRQDELVGVADRWLLDDGVLFETAASSTYTFGKEVDAWPEDEPNGFVLRETPDGYLILPDGGSITAALIADQRPDPDDHRARPPAATWALRRLNAFKKVADENRDKGTGKFKPKTAPDTPGSKDKPKATVKRPAKIEHDDDYPLKDGFRRVTDRAELAEIAKTHGVVIPPSWRNVQVSIDPKAPGLRARGTDAKGRTQPRYSEEHKQAAAAKKFRRILQFEKAAGPLDRAMAADAEKDPTAAATLIMRRMGLRPGSTEDRKADVYAYGATTLEARHVSFSGASVTLDFPSKKGGHTRLTTSDKQVVAVLRAHAAGKTGSTRLFNTSDDATNAYIQRYTPGFSNKDLRTVVGTGYARSLVKKMPKPSSAAAAAKARKVVAEQVSLVLANKPDEALRSYIAPEVFDAAGWP